MVTPLDCRAFPYFWKEPDQYPPIMSDLKYFNLLADQYPNRAQVGKEIVLLESQMNLPKGNEIFLSDIHGEHEPFLHVLKNGSGIIKEKIRALFGSELEEADINQLASIIYYPKEKVDLLLEGDLEPALFYENTLVRLIQISRDFARIYPNRKLLKLLPQDYGDIILEMVAERDLGADNGYYRQVIRSIIDIDQCQQLIISLSTFIQRLAVDRIHIIGDIYDRGPGADIIMEKLIEYHSVDIQWGNHDIVWMGAAAGSPACIANVLRLSLRYANTETLEQGYGINLVQLASFAIEHYKDDKSMVFNPKVTPDELLNQSEQWLNRLMHKAITIIQFKLEGQLIKRRPEFGMEDRLLLDNLNLQDGTVTIDGTAHPLNDTFLPSIIAEDPYRLTAEEDQLMKRLISSFRESAKLQRHVSFLYENGGMYKAINNSLLYHGCIPLTADGQLKSVKLGAEPTKGKALLAHLERVVRQGYFGKSGTSARSLGEDMAWYLWAGPDSPIFGKDKMATFERYFLEDEGVQKETMNAYYDYRDDPKTAAMILQEFGLDDPMAMIMNGHVPVQVKKGESPIKADGKLLVIDGGFAKAYQGQTGIAGFSLISDAYGRQLIAHEPFESTEKAIHEELDIAYSETLLGQSDHMLRVHEMDDGADLSEKITDLRQLLKLFETGQIQERKVGVDR